METRGLKDRYEILSEIGRGGFGCTYRAFDRLLNRFVAVKESENSLAHEANILKALENVPYISHLYDYFQENGRFYIVMRLVDGKSLSQYRQENGGRVSPDFIRRILPSLVITLEQMHERGIIHRDISPGNLLLEGQSTLYLIDFGAATALKDASLKNRFTFIHRGLDAPEHLDSGAQGPWTDVYSLCSTIVFLMTGEGIPSYEDRLRYDPLPSSLLSLSMSGRMQNALLNGLSVDPANRYRTVRSFADAFLGVGNHRRDLESSFTVGYHAKTDIGKRSVNQDNFLIDQLFASIGEDCELVGQINCSPGEIHLAAVADGVAGTQHAELASKAAIQAAGHFVDYYRYDERLMQNLLEEFMTQLNEKILTLGTKIGKTATTISLFAWRNDEYCAVNIGDSPIYLLRKRHLYCLSETQTVARHMLSRGKIPSQKDLHALYHYLGKANTAGESMAYFATGKIEKGDVFLLCTDGIAGISSDQQKVRWLLQDESKTIRSIFNYAHKQQAMDNCTSVLLRF